ncbi:putative aminophospholipid-translocase [Boothiomyces macroporosus]|uniref:Phospholipid-transporting ATPase n=1 Tax=Boothiomyces macroporosus TaxID=261099 RepID=A0AAD5Y5B8_9FUNG|nr:putative aminophospholipid-translocase [Boothiomyces macroporosus]
MFGVQSAKYQRLNVSSSSLNSESIPLENLEAASPSAQHYEIPEIEPVKKSWKFWEKQPPRARIITLGEQTFGLEPNIVQNQKYSVITFIPSVLYEQFKYFLNLYFLLVALSQLIKELQIGYIITYFGPLIFVLEVTMLKEAYDDYIRYCRDQEANSQKYERLTESGTKKVRSSQLKVGDLIIIEKNCKVPADCVLLRTSEESGTCFIRTDQLDGETDWKVRIAVATSQKKPSNHSLLDESATIYAEKPNKDIHSFIGTIRWNYSSGDHIDPLNVENTLWMNTVVVSDAVLGLIVYTGKDTKAGLNTNFVSTKMGLVDLEINQLSKILASVTLALSITMVALDGFRGLWYIYVFRFLILFSSIIPISLRVNLDMGKTFYSYQIMRDKNIPDTIVRTSTIPEELGRIDYLLSDKTGTLTKNGKNIFIVEMELQKLHIGTEIFDSNCTQDVFSHIYNALSPTTGRNVFYQKDPIVSQRVKDIVAALALCHTVTPITDEKGDTSYQAASPDEIAIVRWTSLVGLKLVFRDLDYIRLDFNGITLEYKILESFPFTSELKRMGIILQDTKSKVITFYQKGADSIMSAIVSHTDWLEDACSNMANEGLRTLVFGRKVLSPEHYEEFQEQFKIAKTALKKRAESIQSVISTYLERDLELLGLTGVEDKLQDNVKLTLQLLRQAGIKIWMLTGDKIETARCIAISSKLVERYQPIHQITKVKNVQQAFEELDNVRLLVDPCLIIDGKSLQFYLDHLPQEFISLALSIPVVVCSRCNPTQKSDIVKLIKNSTDKRTCAIGDGGNDVSMIQSAHVGIGLVGKEGMQASLAADFSITTFSHLNRLLLWHGRNSYKRSAKLAHFVIHRG